MSAGPIVFCATGVTQMLGGIASANRNVLAALQALGRETGRPVITLVLSEPAGEDPDYRGFGQNRIAFALAAVNAAMGAALVVVDHVRLAAPILALPRALRGPVAVCAHGSEATWRIRPSSVRAFARADLVLTNSHYTLARMAAYAPRFNGAACPLGLPPQFEMTAAPPPPSTAEIEMAAADGQVRRLGEQVLLLVARMDATEKEKGHRELIAALPSLNGKHPGAQLVFVGAGTDLEPLRTEAAASASAANIFLPGRMEAAQLERLYARAYAYVMPSRQEGFGLVYLEAMNYAKPCLACRDDGGGEVVIDGETGVLVDRQFSGSQLLDALDRLLVDPARARSYGEAGWRRLSAHYTSAAHQKRVADLLRPLVKGT